MSVVDEKYENRREEFPAKDRHISSCGTTMSYLHIFVFIVEYTASDNVSYFPLLAVIFFFLLCHPNVSFYGPLFSFHFKVNQISSRFRLFFVLFSLKQFLSLIPMFRVSLVSSSFRVHLFSSCFRILLFYFYFRVPFFLFLFQNSFALSSFQSFFIVSPLSSFQYCLGI